MAHTALVSGGNRGIGLEVCRQLAARGLVVLLGARDPALGHAAAQELGVRPVRLDVTDPASVLDCAARLGRERVEIDVLVNNAGTFEEGALLGADAGLLPRSLEVHLLGAYRLARAFLPGMNRRGYGRVVNVTSGYGSFAAGLHGPPAYAIAKAAQNALTVTLARETQGDVKVNAADPGWVRTRMGGPQATASVEDAAAGIVWLATLPEGGPSGGVFRGKRKGRW